MHARLCVYMYFHICYALRKLVPMDNIYLVAVVDNSSIHSSFCYLWYFCLHSQIILLICACSLFTLSFILYLSLFYLYNICRILYMLRHRHTDHTHTHTYLLLHKYLTLFLSNFLLCLLNKELKYIMF